MSGVVPPVVGVQIVVPDNRRPRMVFAPAGPGEHPVFARDRRSFGSFEVLVGEREDVSRVLPLHSAISAVFVPRQWLPLLRTSANYLLRAPLESESGCRPAPARLEVRLTSSCAGERPTGSAYWTDRFVLVSDR